MTFTQKNTDEHLHTQIIANSITHNELINNLPPVCVMYINIHIDLIFSPNKQLIC